jgi:C-terminal processing protease CtpA/Prc
VKYIHTDEIDIQGNSPATIYQSTLVLADSKNALTFQCPTEDDLKHLVSTLQYFIRSSRLGRDTALAGMPYSNQGMVLNNDGVVDKLWADSPADRAGVQLGDYLWSIGKITAEQQGKKDLETGLQSATAVLYCVTASEWQKALTASRQPGQANGFRPKLRKVVLTAS